MSGLERGGAYDAYRMGTRDAGRGNGRCRMSPEEREETRRLTNLAIRSGELIRRPCEVCGSVNVHVHHRDYSNHLDVMWLCEQHHREEHRRQPPIGGGKVGRPSARVRRWPS